MTAQGKNTGKKTFIRWIRTGVQIAFFLAVLTTTLGKALSAWGVHLTLPAASLHSVCPFGGVVSFYQLITQGTFVQKIHESSFVVLFLLVLLSLLVGPAFCGWVCPLGSLQEWIGKIGRKLFRRKYNHMIPAKLDRILRYLRYGVLIWVLIVTAVSAKLLFQNVDPFYALFTFYTGEVAVGALAVLGVTAVLSLFIERPWCKYLCPFGALLGLFNLIRVFTIRRRANSCIGCGACDRACPMNIAVSGKKAVRDHQCISCMRCTSEDACLVPDTVTLCVKGERK